MRAYKKLERTKILVKASENAKSKPNPPETNQNPTEIKPNQIKSNQNLNKLKQEAKSNQIQAQAQAKPNQPNQPKASHASQPSLEPAKP